MLFSPDPSGRIHKSDKPQMSETKADLTRLRRRIRFETLPYEDRLSDLHGGRLARNPENAGSYTSAYIQKAIDRKTVHTLAVQRGAHRLLQVNQLLRRLRHLRQEQAQRLLGTRTSRCSWRR